MKKYESPSILEFPSGGGIDGPRSVCITGDIHNGNCNSGTFADTCSNGDLYDFNRCGNGDLNVNS